MRACAGACAFRFPRRIRYSLRLVGVDDGDAGQRGIPGHGSSLRCLSFLFLGLSCQSLVVSLSHFCQVRGHNGQMEKAQVGYRIIKQGLITTKKN